MKEVSADLLPKARKKHIPPEEALDGEFGMMTKKPRAKRGTGVPRRQAPRKFQWKAAIAVPDLNLLPPDEADVSLAAPKPVRKRAPRKKAMSKDTRYESSLTASNSAEAPLAPPKPVWKRAPQKKPAEKPTPVEADPAAACRDFDLNVSAEPTMSPMIMKTVRWRAPKKTPCPSSGSSCVADVESTILLPNLNAANDKEAPVPAPKAARKRAPRKISATTATTGARKGRGRGKTVFTEVGPLLTALSEVAVTLPSDSTYVGGAPSVRVQVEVEGPTTSTDDSENSRKETCALDETTATIEDNSSGRNGVVGTTAEGADGTVKVEDDIHPRKIRRDSKKKWGESIKRGCLAHFTVKVLQNIPHVTEVYIIQARHVNSDGLVVHGGVKAGERSAFSAHLSPEIKFLDNCLHHGDTSAQILKKHIQFLKKWQADGKEITRDLLITTKDIWNVLGKLASETYMLHQNDAQSLRMWVQKNPESVFYYSETNAKNPVEVGGGLTSENMPFTIGI